LVRHYCSGQHTMATSLWCRLYVSRGLIRRREIIMASHHCSWQHTMATSLWCSTWT